MKEHDVIEQQHDWIDRLLDGEDARTALRLLVDPAAGPAGRSGIGTWKETMGEYKAER